MKAKVSKVSMSLHGWSDSGTQRRTFNAQLGTQELREGGTAALGTGHLVLFVCLFVCLFVWGFVIVVFVCLFVCLFVWGFVCRGSRDWFDFRQNSRGQLRTTTL